MPDSFALEQAVSCLTRVRQACDDRDELARAFADLAHAATVRLAQHARSAVPQSQTPLPMLLFGGTFQCHPLRNPYRLATDPQHIVQAVASLFAKAVDVWSAKVSATQDTEQLVQAAAAVAEQLTTDVMQIAEHARIKCKAAEDALAQLAQITIRQRELESRQAEQEQATVAARTRVATLQAEIAALEGEFAASTEEAQRLSAQLADLRSRVKPIDELRSECSALTQQVATGERELAELQQKRNDALRQRHEMERKLNDTRAMMQQVEVELDATVVQRIRQIWEQLPPDVFDERMRSS